ncbi:sensor histidine kinase [Streptomyces sp. NBC_01240]|uniref:sensor histidine kinase n=1 Tax=Streptomyces sp. NBC_01240 TaxID=2903793 RepID=UPI002E0E4CB9|nr:histidine kinase [Streptomyces sp. NBC_01240]
MRHTALRAGMTHLNRMDFPASVTSRSYNLRTPPKSWKSMLRFRRPISRHALTAGPALVLLVGGTVALLALDLVTLPLSRRSAVTALILLILLPAVLLGQYAPPPYRLRYRFRWALLVLQALLTYGPVLLLKLPWLSLLGFLAGAVLLTVPRPASVLVAVAVCASGPLLVSGLEFENRSGLGVLLATLTTAGSVYGIAQLALFVARLHAAQNHAAHAAVQTERDRIAGDLHDVIGSALTLIANRASLGTEDEESAAVLDEIAAIARRTLAEVRAVSRDNVTLSLATELAQVAQVLATAGITVRSDIAPFTADDLPRAVDHCLAVVAREAVANVLHHSRAAHCSISLSIVHKAATDRSVEFSVGNDAPDSPGTAAPGTGLTSLAARAAALGGTVTAERPSPGHFRLLVRLPLPLGSGTRTTGRTRRPDTPPGPAPRRDAVG